MKESYLHIHIVLDRSGSMQSIKEDIIGGFNTFLNDQKKNPGTATLTLVQFDGQDPYEVIHHFKPIAQIKPLDSNTYVPRASTPLLDALGKSINDVQAGIKRLDKFERPDKTIMVIITDGMENASRRFKRDEVMKMIEAKKEEAWQFVFLSADMGAVAEAGYLGFKEQARMRFNKTPQGTSDAFGSLSNRISKWQTEKTDFMFSEADRAKQDEPGSQNDQSFTES